MENLLKEKGLKITPARLAILDIFSKSKVPTDAETIWKKVNKRKDCLDVNEVTVYRTLTSLEEAGILRKVDMRKDSVFFELASNHHHHIVCTSCDAVEDFKSPEVEKILQKIASRSAKFKNIKEHSLELFGVCQKCN